MKKITRCIALFMSFFVLPLVASAHEKWFINSIPAEMQKPDFFAEYSLINIVMALVAMVALILATVLHYGIMKEKIVKRAHSFLSNYKQWVAPVMRGSLGILLVVAAYGNFLMAPDLLLETLSGGLARTLVYMQLIIGIMLALGIYVRFAGLLGMLLVAVSFLYFPTITLLPYVAFLGLFMYLAMLGDKTLPIHRQGGIFPALQRIVHGEHWEPYALPLLRILLGLSFFIAGLYFKVIEPRYTLQMVTEHGLNFMPLLGMPWFSNEMFVFSAGLTEMLLGIMLLLGILPRLVAVFVMGMFTLTTFIFGMPEIAGHLPLYAGLLAILVLGPGRWTFVPSER